MAQFYDGPNCSQKSGLETNEFTINQYGCSLMRGQLSNALLQDVTNTPRDISKKHCHSNKP